VSRFCTSISEVVSLKDLRLREKTINSEFGREKSFPGLKLPRECQLLLPVEVHFEKE
jgi:hypothetical protein